MRGSSSPRGPSRRTKASDSARQERLLGNSTSSRANTIGSSPALASSPAASASTKALCGGIVETLGLAPSPTRNHRFGLRAGARRADIDPHALLRAAVPATRPDRPAPPQVPAEHPSGGIVAPGFPPTLHPA